MLIDNGLYVVELTQPYLSNMAGDICGLPPDVAQRLLAEGRALEYPRLELEQSPAPDVPAKPKTARRA